MSDTEKPKPGSIVWHDLTVDNADEVRDFYSAVVGWETEAVSMGDYDDHVMKVAETGEGVTGVCHARGSNANMPPQWMIYVSVDDVEQAAKKAVEAGGSVAVSPSPCPGRARRTTTP